MSSYKVNGVDLDNILEPRANWNFDTGKVVPALMQGLVNIGNSSWKYTSCGNLNALAIKTNGSLWTWGSNIAGQLGQGDTIDRSVPTQVGYYTNWLKAEISNSNSLALKTDGTIWTCGITSQNNINPSFTQVGTDIDWVDISLSKYNYYYYNNYNANTMFYGIKADRTLWSWSTTTLPVKDNNALWKTVGSTSTVTVGIKTDGTLWVRGDNTFYNTGVSGGLPDTVNFYQIGTDNDWKSVSCGAYHIIVQKEDGSIWGWGFDRHNEILPGNFDFLEYILVPRRIGTMNDWYQVTAGQYFTMALKVDGTLWGWGYNGQGQLGISNTTPVYNSQYLISSNSNWNMISAGTLYSTGILY